MSQKELIKFIEKVEQLKALIDSLDKVEGRRQALERCEKHDEVVALANSWGYSIGRRWGED